MNKLILFIFMTVAIAINGYAVRDYDFEVDGIYYKLPDVSGNTCIIVGGDDEKIGDNLIIPGSVTYRNKTFSVAGIAFRAFDHSKIKHLTIEDGVGFISSCAFWGSLLESVEIKGVINISDDVFENCYNLSSFNAPLLQTFGSGCFRGTKLKEFKIPKTMSSIPLCSFEYSEIQTVEIPNSIKKIESEAFRNCKNLKRVFIPKSITEIEEGAFSNCEIESLVIEESDDPLTIYPSFYEKDDYGTSIHYSLFHSSFYNTQVHSYENLERKLNIIDRNKKLATDYKYPSSEGNYSGESISILTPISLQYELIIGSEPGYHSSYYIWNNVQSNGNGVHTVKNRDIIEIPYFKHVDSFERIIVKSQIPPVFLEDPKFQNRDYMNWNIYVPIGTKPAYEDAPIWKNFWNIIESDFSDLSFIKDITTEQSKQEVSRFDINGTSVSKNYKGLVIIRYSDGSIKKQIVK